MVKSTSPEPTIPVISGKKESSSSGALARLNDSEDDTFDFSTSVFGQLTSDLQKILGVGRNKGEGDHGFLFHLIYSQLPTNLRLL